MADHLQHTDGVMIGRAAYDNPYLLATADALFYGTDTPPPTRRQVLEAILPYLDTCDAHGLPATRTVRHLLGLFAYQPVAKAWRRFISANLRQTSPAGPLIREAMSQVPDTILDAIPQAVPRETPQHQECTAAHASRLSTMHQS
jgi:tRNA-dihydrouridine synthase A